MVPVSVYARVGSPRWYAAFPDPKSGDRVCKVTDFRVDDPQGKRRALDWARRQAMEGLLTRSEGTAPEWENWVPGWIELKYRKKPASLRNSNYWWSWLSLYLREKNIRTPRALSRSAVLNYIPWRLLTKKRSGKTPSYNSAIQELKFLSRVVREAMLRDFTERNPAERLGLAKDDAPEKPEISDKEIVLIREKLATIEGDLPVTKRWMTVSFELALHTGVRFRETSLPLSRVDLEKDVIILRDAKKDELYGIPIHRDLRPLLVELKQAGAEVTCVLPNRASIEWLHFFKGRKERGEQPFLPHLCFHCTRVTVVTRMARAGVPIQMAKELVHHADDLISKLYTRLKPSDLLQCLKALNYPAASGGGRPDETPGDSRSSAESAAGS